LSVCLSVTYLSLTQNWNVVFIFYVDVTPYTGEWRCDLKIKRSKGQGHWERKCKKAFFSRIACQQSVYRNSRCRSPTTGESSNEVWYSRNRIIHLSWGPHVVAAICPCICLLQRLVDCTYGMFTLHV